MCVAEAKETPHPAEPELTFQRNGVRLVAERTHPLATRKEPEAEGSPIMDDWASDGRGARIAGSGFGNVYNGSTAAFTKVSVVPRKIRELIADLEAAGFENRQVERGAIETLSIRTLPSRLLSQGKLATMRRIFRSGPLPKQSRNLSHEYCRKIR